MLERWEKDKTVLGARTGNQEDKLRPGGGPDWWEMRLGKRVACKTGHHIGATASVGRNVAVKRGGRNDRSKEEEGMTGQKRRKERPRRRIGLNFSDHNSIVLTN